VKKKDVVVDFSAYPHAGDAASVIGVPSVGNINGCLRRAYTNVLSKMQIGRFLLFLDPSSLVGFDRAKVSFIVNRIGLWSAAGQMRHNDRSCSQITLNR
jgi:hypothetical protein